MTDENQDVADHPSADRSTAHEPQPPTASTLTPEEIAQLLLAVGLGNMTAKEAKAAHHRINAHRRGNAAA